MAEDAIATARQVFGAQHPFAQNMISVRDQNLAKIRAVGGHKTACGEGELTGLASKPELNGCTVCIVGCDAAKGRYHVLFRTTNPNYSSKPLGIKPANVVLADVSAVIVQGLIGAREWNGRRGLIVRFNHETERYELKIAGRERTLNVKLACCRLESMPEMEPPPEPEPEPQPEPEPERESEQHRAERSAKMATS